MRKLLEIGGVIAAVILIAFGIAAVVLGFNGRDTVGNTLQAEYITGTPDMTPTAIKPEVASIKSEQAKLAAQFKAAGVDFQATPVSAPSCSVAGESVDGGDSARCFAQYMRIHALAGTSGLVYSQMGRWVAKEGTPFEFTDGIGGTNEEKYAVVDAKTQQPVANGRRDLWVTETALTTALNASYMADQISVFGIVVGFALLLAGIGFGILALGGALRNPETALKFLHRGADKDTGAPAAPAR
jgi:hypothetical protein